MPATAQENNTTTNGNETNATETPTLPPTPTVTETQTPAPTEAKFRVAPTVALRPVNNVIDKVPGRTRRTLHEQPICE